MSRTKLPLKECFPPPGTAAPKTGNIIGPCPLSLRSGRVSFLICNKHAIMGEYIEKIRLIRARGVIISCKYPR